VFVTVDVELWPQSWDQTNRGLAKAFDRYIMGNTSRGSVGLPFQLRMAKDYGLKFSFFVESLFACEMGIDALTEIVHMIIESGQEIQLHAHPEWINHSKAPFLDLGGRFLFGQLDEHEQRRLIEVSLGNMANAGVDVVAFRSGSFSSNPSTLQAVSGLGLGIDCSLKLGAELPDATALVHSPAKVNGLMEYPLTTFFDWPGHRRDLQLAACSLTEITHVLHAARSFRWNSVVLLSHSAELLTADRSRPDRVVMRRFEGLCRFLSESRKEFSTAWFRDEGRQRSLEAAAPAISSTPWLTLGRVSEQVMSRFLGRM
jgi:hypothetical protein